MRHIHDNPSPRSLTAPLELWEVDTALRWFMYHLDTEKRAKLMADLPGIYSKMTGVPMAVRNANDASEGK